MQVELLVQVGELVLLFLFALFTALLRFLVEEHKSWCVRVLYRQANNLELLLLEAVAFTVVEQL